MNIVQYMYESVLSLKDRHPALYRYLKRIFWSTRNVTDRILGTRVQEAIWRTRHIYKGASWVKGYCDSIDHPHRAWLIECLARYAPIDSILEIGCNTGPNLYLLSKRFPAARLYGVEINRKAVEVGDAWLYKMGVTNVRLSVGKADNLPFYSKSIDLVFTDAVLLYVGPDKIERTIRGMERVARKELIFNEHHQQTGKTVYMNGNWVHDYSRLFPRAKITKIPDGLWGGSEGWNRYGALIEVSL